MTKNKKLNSPPDEVFIAQKTWAGGAKGALHLHLTMPEPFANQEVRKYTIAPPVPVDTINIKREVLQGVREAVEFYTMFEDRPDEDPNEKFERIGKVFFKETSYLRPGKDCILHSNEERQAVWDRWRDGKAVRAQDSLASLDAVLSEGE